jgi:hypothetical protein
LPASCPTPRRFRFFPVTRRRARFTKPAEISGRDCEDARHVTGRRRGHDSGGKGFLSPRPPRPPSRRPVESHEDGVLRPLRCLSMITSVAGSSRPHFGARWRATRYLPRTRRPSTHACRAWLPALHLGFATRGAVDGRREAKACQICAAVWCSVTNNTSSFHVLRPLGSVAPCPNRTWRAPQTPNKDAAHLSAVALVWGARRASRGIARRPFSRLRQRPTGCRDAPEGVSAEPLGQTRTRRLRGAPQRLRAAVNRWGARTGRLTGDKEPAGSSSWDLDRDHAVRVGGASRCLTAPAVNSWRKAVRLRAVEAAAAAGFHAGARGFNTWLDAEARVFVTPVMKSS